MANGRSQRVDSAIAERRGQAARFSFDLPLKPFVDGGWYWYDVVAGDDDVVVESAEWIAEVPADRAAARHRRHRDHHDEPPRLLRQAARPDRRRPRSCAPYLDTGDGHGAGHPEGAPTREFFPAAEKSLGDMLRRHRAGQPRRLRRLRPRPARVGPQGHRDLRHDDGRRRRLRARGHHPRDHLRRPGAAARRSSAATCSASTTAPSCTASARSCSPGGSGGRRRLDGYSRVGPRRPATCAPRAGCTSASTSTSTAGSCA